MVSSFPFPAVRLSSVPAVSPADSVSTNEGAFCWGRGWCYLCTYLNVSWSSVEPVRPVQCVLQRCQTFKYEHKHNRCVYMHMHDDSNCQKSEKILKNLFVVCFCRMKLFNSALWQKTFSLNLSGRLYFSFEKAEMSCTDMNMWQNLNVLRCKFSRMIRSEVLFSKHTSNWHQFLQKRPLYEDF